MEAVRMEWSSEAEGERKWGVLRDGMKRAAERILGWETGLQFQDNISKLEELILKCNVLFVRWLKTNYQRDRREVRRSKNA